MIDLKETSVTFRLPKYMKDYLSVASNASELSIGEYIRALLFLDMRVTYGGLDKVSQLRKAYESCNGLISGGVVDYIFGAGETKDINADFIESLVRKSFVDKEAPPEVSREQLVAQALKEGKKKIAKPHTEEPPPTVVEQKNEQTSVEETARPSKTAKIERPVMGDTNYIR